VKGPFFLCWRSSVSRSHSEFRFCFFFLFATSPECDGRLARCLVPRFSPSVDIGLPNNVGRQFRTSKTPFFLCAIIAFNLLGLGITDSRSGSSLIIPQVSCVCRWGRHFIPVLIGHFFLRSAATFRRTPYSSCSPVPRYYPFVRPRRAKFILLIPPVNYWPFFRPPPWGVRCAAFTRS